MSNMKCPFCKEEIISDLCFLFDKEDKDYTSGRQIYKCNKCGLFGTKELWQEFIRTRKALDVAVDALKTVKRYLCEMPAPDSATVLRMTCESATTVKKALEQITALEQKDVK